MIFGFVVAICAYFLGSIPSGYIAGKIMGVDIRKVGSGNIGATNAFRILGKTAGSLVLIADGLKGWLSVAVLPDLLLRLIGHATGTETVEEYYRVIAGVVAILGHNFTIWLHFKGGKGIATSAGVLAAMVPMTFLIALALWIVVCVITRYVSVASIAAALVLPFASWYAHYSGLMIGITAALGLLAIWKHKGNIQRLMNGTENKIGARKSAPDEGGKA